mgnify:CR=1 FL=1
MTKKVFSLGLELSFEDMCSIGAACGAMSLSILKSADCADDVKEALHLADLHMRIDRALDEATKHRDEENVVAEEISN